MTAALAEQMIGRVDLDQMEEAEGTRDDYQPSKTRIGDYCRRGPEDDEDYAEESTHKIEYDDLDAMIRLRTHRSRSPRGVMTRMRTR